MSAPALTVAVMDSPVVHLNVLFPDLAEQKRPFEVVLTVPRPDDGEPLVPCTLPAEVLGCWSADQSLRRTSQSYRGSARRATRTPG